MIDVGYKNFIDEIRINEMVKPDCSHARWLRKEAIAGRMLIDCTQGRKTNSVIRMKSGHIILSSLRYTSLLRRLKSSGIKVTLSRKDINKELLKEMDKIDDSKELIQQV
jgi:extracellular matrix regulatory protein A